MPYYKKKYVPKSRKTARKNTKGFNKNKSLVSLIKKVTLKQSELKYCDYNYGKTELYHNIHNNFATTPITGIGPIQGNGDAQRIGNEILLSGIKLTFMFYTKLDRPNTKFRVIIYSAPYNSYSPANTYATIFDDVTSNTMIDSVDKDAIKVHKQFYVYPKNISANLTGLGTDVVGKEVTTFRKIWVPYRTKVKFVDDASTAEITNRSYYVMVMAYDSYGSLTTDNVGAVQCWQRYFYRDP